MKNYGDKKATEFTKKQVGVLFSKAKTGELKVEKWFMSKIYDLADFYGYDDNGSVEKDEQAVLEILDAMFSGDTEKVQGLINEMTDHMFNLYTPKFQAKFNRNLVD